MPVRHLWRLVRTGATFARTGALDEVLGTLDAPATVRIGLRTLSWPVKWLGLRGDPAYPPLVRAITALGPSYIKFGQILSTRPDVVGADLSKQLRILQDNLPPFSEVLARQEIEREFGKPVDALFSEFSAPIAAASIAQVHCAVIRDSGQKVAVKVRRPDIAKAFARDIDAFFMVARLIELLAPATRRLRPRAVVAHFDSVVQGELDFRLEASAASEFEQNTKNDPGFTLPQVKWHLSAERVLTTEWADGYNLRDVEQIAGAGFDLEELAQTITQSFLRHALRDGFFHGDMHQGNLKIAENGDVIALDFGIMGRIDLYTRKVYAEILYGFLNRDYFRVAEVHFEAGYVPADRDVNAFAQALRAIGEPIFGQDAAQISMAKLLSHLFEVTERFGMPTRTELLLLQRTMVVVEGVSRSLDPNMNMWETARPVVEDYVRSNIGPRAVMADVAKTARVLARFGPLLPQMVEDQLIKLHAEPAPKRRKRRVPGGVWFALGLVYGAGALFAMGQFLNI